MSLEELKALWDAAKVKSLAAPDDKKLEAEAAQAEKAYTDAKAGEDAKTPGGPGTEPSDDLDESKLDDKTKTYLAKLRKENATHRTKNKDLASKLKVTDEQKHAILKAIGIETDDSKPEDKIKALQNETDNLAFRTAVLESAVQHGIGKDEVDYFQFLVSKATSELNEGEELTDDALKEIVAKCKKIVGKVANTSVGTGGGAPNPKPGISDEVSLDKFCRMNMTEKSLLYEKNRDLYVALTAEAKLKKRLV